MKIALIIVGLIVFAGLVIGGWIWFKKHNPKKAEKVEKVVNKAETETGKAINKIKEKTKKN